MNHWTDPMMRGIFDHPAAPPPTPAPHHANDLGARLAHLETHTIWSAWNAQRVEMESRARAEDIRACLRDLHMRMTTQEGITLNRGTPYMTKWLADLFGSPRQALQTIIGLLAIAGVLTGKLTLSEASKMVFGGS